MSLFLRFSSIVVWIHVLVSPVFELLLFVVSLLDPFLCLSLFLSVASSSLFLGSMSLFLRCFESCLLFFLGSISLFRGFWNIDCCCVSGSMSMFLRLLNFAVRCLFVDPSPCFPLHVLGSVALFLRLLSMSY